jgi:hypothetical protein
MIILNTHFNILGEEEMVQNNGNQLLEIFTQRKENIGTLHSIGNEDFKFYSNIGPFICFKKLEFSNI